MPTLFIAGTGTDVGKTYVSAALIRALREANVAVDALKPVVSGFAPDAPAGSDPAVLLEALGRPWSAAALEAMSPWRYRAPLSPPLAAAREGARLDGAAVIAFCRERSAAVPPGVWLLVESAGGVMSPLDERLTMLDLAAALRAPVLLVAGSYLGTISHTLTAAAVIAGAKLPLAGIVLSESPGAPPPIEETLAALASRVAPAPVLALGRGEGLTREALEMLGVT
jgi:dethiobiotin synthetase